MSCTWDIAMVADAITSTTGRIATTGTIKYKSAPENDCISDYSEGNYSINGNKVRIEKGINLVCDEFLKKLQNIFY